jgi:acetyl-CoA acetyltransferase
MKAVLVAAKRTPIGSFLNAFSEFSAVELGTAATRAVVEGLPIGHSNAGRNRNRRVRRCPSSNRRIGR